MYYVYILHNTSTKLYYVGYSSDLKKRLHEHLSWQNISTRNDCKSWELVYYEAYLSEKSARQRELQLKAHGKWISVIKERIKNDILEK